MGPPAANAFSNRLQHCKDHFERTNSTPNPQHRSVSVDYCRERFEFFPPRRLSTIWKPPKLCTKADKIHLTPGNQFSFGKIGGPLLETPVSNQKCLTPVFQIHDTVLRGIDSPTGQRM